MTNREAIKTLHELWRTTNDPWYEKVYEMAINALTAQPETHEKRTETHACDLISRQAAVEAFDNLEWFHQNANKDMVSGANSEHHQAWYKEQDVYKALERVPSAQPIIRCKECKHWLDIDDGRQKHRMCADIYGDWFCADAERRNDG